MMGDEHHGEDDHGRQIATAGKPELIRRFAEPQGQPNRRGDHG
jgi:hypothetical protein